MQDLTLVGVHDDGEHLVLSGPDGQRFRVQVDEQLRAAVRRDRARLGQLQIEMDGRLRPRDIQARIRAGQTAEEIAEAANLPVEHVRRYEGPVLAEREFVVRQARAVRIRRPAGSSAGRGNSVGATPTLGDLVAERLTAREVLEAHSAWDAWRADDGAWIVALTFTAGSRERRATWTYDAQLRHVTAQDDEARWLTEDEPAPAAAAPARRLVPIRSHDPLRPEVGAVHDRVYDVEADGGVRPSEHAAPAAHSDPHAAQAPPYPTAAHPLPASAGSAPGADSSSAPTGSTGSAARRGHPAGQGSGAFGGSAESSATIDLLDTLRERRGRRQKQSLPYDEDLDPFETDPPAIWTLEPGFDADLPPAAHPPRSRPDLARDAELLELPDTPPRGIGIRLEAAPLRVPNRDSGPDSDNQTPAETASAASSAGSPASPAAASSPAQAAAATATPAAPPARRAKRASVPSWDDIVFGSRRE